jgi:hypothetical protein
MWPPGASLSARNNVSEEQVELVRPVIERLDSQIDFTSARLRARRALVRARLPGSLYIHIDDQFIHLCGQAHFGMPHVIWYHSPRRTNSLQQILDKAKYDIGFTDPYGVTMPYNVALTLDSPHALAILRAIALEYVQSEIRKFNMAHDVIQINPIFGEASFAMNKKFMFVLMPFNDEMNAIYYLQDKTMYRKITSA